MSSIVQVAVVPQSGNHTSSVLPKRKEDAFTLRYTPIHSQIGYSRPSLLKSRYNPSAHGRARTKYGGTVFVQLGTES